MIKKLATIGYESATLPEFINCLKEAEVGLVIDVRAIAASRRPGFSKTILAASLSEHGINYIHLRQLGTPKAGREAARAGRLRQMEGIFAQHLEEPASRLALLDAADLAGKHKSALLCFERDPSRCHRSIVADHVALGGAFAIEHLIPMMDPKVRARG